MKTHGWDPGSASGAEADSPSRLRAPCSDSYDSANQIAADLKTVLLGEFRYETDAGPREADLSLLSGEAWEGQCEGLVSRLVQLRETSPLDVVAVSALTEGVSMKPFMYSLGMAMRRVLQRVVLMDCDLRAPSLQAAGDGGAVEGFIDMVKYGCSFFMVSRETEVSGLYVIGAGSHPVLSEGELVGKDLERAFNSLRTKSDITFALVPPFLPGTRVNPILGCVDGVLVCVSRPSAERRGVAECFTRLWKSDVPLLGVVNHEPRDFEQRTTVELNVASHTGEPGRLSDGPRVSAEDAAHTGRARKGDVPGAVSPETIRLEVTPEFKPLLSGSEGDSEESPDEKAGKETGAGSGLWGAGGAPDIPAVRRARRRPWSRVRSAEERLLDRELFGRRRISSRLALIIGLPAVLVVLAAAVILAPRLSRQPVERMSADMMRSILLPGADGVVSAREVNTAQVAAPSLAKGSDTSAASLGEATYYVHASSHKLYDSALSDSARVAAAGFPVSLQLVQLSESGRWYRVLAGPFHTSAAAGAAAARIEPMGLAKQVRIIQQGVDQ